MREAETDTGIVLTIAGSDPSGGAGIQADIKTIGAFGLYGMSVITAVTAQNTTGVQSVNPVEPEVVAAQLDSVFSDIIPDVVKIGMLANDAIVKVVVEKIRHYHPHLVVLDPVMLSSSGTELLNQAGRIYMAEHLLPMVTVITPNIPEAKELERIAVQIYGAQKTVQNDLYEQRDIEYVHPEHRRMAERISLLFGSEMDKKHAVLIKGGHLPDKQCDDYLYWFRQFSGRDENSIVAPQEIVEGRKVMEFVFHGERIECQNTHGTGCTLSAAIACGLAKGLSVETSVREAKQYITKAIERGLPIGHGSGPLNHFWMAQKWKII